MINNIPVFSNSFLIVIFDGLEEAAILLAHVAANYAIKFRSPCFNKCSLPVGIADAYKVDCPLFFS